MSKEEAIIGAIHRGNFRRFLDFRGVKYFEEKRLSQSRFIFSASPEIIQEMKNIFESHDH